QRIDSALSGDDASRSRDVDAVSGDGIRERVGAENGVIRRVEEDEVARAQLGEAVLHILPRQGGIRGYVIQGGRPAKAGVKAQDVSKYSGGTRINAAEPAIVVPGYQNSLDGSPGGLSGHDGPIRDRRSRR